MTQEQKVLQWYEVNKSITPRQAWEQLGIYRLSSVIFRLRKNYDILTESLVVKDRDGNRTEIARYWFNGKRKGLPQA